MLFDNKEKLSQPRVVDNTSIIKQNYAPFISKCSRFQTKNLSSSRLPNIKVFLKTQDTIHNLSRSREKSQETMSSQFFFKSQNERFNHQNLMQTPSPAHYHVDTSKGSKEKSQDKGPKRLFPGIKTIPAIPDYRNKFGYNFEDKSYELIQKTSLQLQREKNLMKKYQQTLTNEAILNRQSKRRNNLHQQRQFQQKVKKIVQKSSQMEKQNRPSHNNSLCQLGKPKFNHLYQYHPIQQKQTNLIRLKNLKSQQTANKKYQFFNSSQYRFKTAQTQVSPKKQRLGVRDYLQIVLKIGKI